MGKTRGRITVILHSVTEVPKLKEATMSFAMWGHELTTKTVANRKWNEEYIIEEFVTADTNLKASLFNSKPSHSKHDTLHRLQSMIFPPSCIGECTIDIQSLMDHPNEIKEEVYALHDKKHSVDVAEVKLGLKFSVLDGRLHELIEDDDFEGLRNLLASGAEVNYGSVTPLHSAVRANNSKITKYLLKEGAKTDLHDLEGNTAIHIAVASGHLKIVKILLRANKEINVKNEHGEAPLHIGAANGQTAIVKHLITKKAKIDPTELSHDYTPLHFACIQGSLEVVELLCEAGANIDFESKEKKTPLFLACSHANSSNIIKKLLHYGADPNHTDVHKRTPFLMACLFSQLNAIDALLQSHHLKVDFGAVDDKGENCFHIACHKGDPAVVKLLVKHLKDHNLIEQPNSKGKTPCEIAEHYNHPTICAMLNRLK